MLLPSSSHPSSEDWNSIAVHLVCAVEYREWREALWLRECVTDSDEPGRVRAYRLVEATHKQQLDAAVEQWLTDDTLPTLEHPASYLLALRFVTVGHFLGSLEGFFPPPPSQQTPEIYRKFLLQWWHKHGASYAVGFSCSGYDFYWKPNSD